MTEAEWLVCANPESMLHSLMGAAGERKSRLFAVACCRRVWGDIRDAACRAAVEATERFVEGAETEEGRRRRHGRAEAAHGACYAEFGHDHPATRAAFAAMSASAHAMPWLVGYNVRTAAAMAAKGAADLAPDRGVEGAEQAALLRDIFGNPFRPVSADPPWFTADVVALAAGIYEERAFDRLSILADALQDAGCDDVDLLDHCRQPGEHVRGCWVIDLLLGKG